MTLWSTGSYHGGYVLARFGVPAKTLSVSRLFIGSMLARVRTGDGEHWAWFRVTHVLRQSLRAIAFSIQHALLRYVARYPRSIQRGRLPRAKPSPPK